MNKRLIACVGLLGTLAISPAMAVDGDYVYPSFTLPISDAERHSDHDYAFQLMLGRSFSEFWNLEAGVQGNKFIRDDRSFEYIQQSLNLDLLFFPFGKAVTSPYVQVGAGLMQTDYAGEKYINGTTNYAVGVFHDLGEPGQWMWRTSLGLRQDYDSTSAPAIAYFQDVMISVGAVYVYQNDHRYENMLSDRQARLEEARRRAAEAANKEKLIPAKPASSVASGSICALGGGICGASGVPSFTLQFALDSSILDEEAQRELDRVVGYMKAFPDLKAEIIGHTDIAGSETPAYNKWLSDRRAFRVHGYLHEKGVYPGRLKVQGYGQSKPLTPNVSGDHRAKNRRVEIRLFR